MKGTWNTTWAGKIPPLLFWQGGANHHRPQALVSMFKKDVATLLQHIQCILLKIHQYRVQVMYKPGQIFLLQTGYQGTTHRGQGQTDRGHGCTGRHCTKAPQTCQMCIYGGNSSGIGTE